MNVDESLERYGFQPPATDLSRIREMLEAQAERDQYCQDTELMSLCCQQLFHAGQLAISHAKESSRDAHSVIGVQLPCRAGLPATKAYLAAEGSGDAAEALQYLRECEEAGDFATFSVEGQKQWRADYFSSRSLASRPTQA